MSRYIPRRLLIMISVEFQRVGTSCWSLQFFPMLLWANLRVAGVLWLKYVTMFRHLFYCRKIIPENSRLSCIASLTARLKVWVKHCICRHLQIITIAFLTFSTMLKVCMPLTKKIESARKINCMWAPPLSYCHVESRDTHVLMDFTWTSSTFLQL